jgi:activating signal cointegrator complex subunit 3
MLGPDTDEAEALRLLASCEECVLQLFTTPNMRDNSRIRYSELPVRHNEDVMNEEMSKGARFPLGGGAWDSPHVKTELLLQAHMQRAPLPIVDYVTDTRSVMEQAIRIVTAMIDVASDCGWARPVRACLSLLQGLTQGCFWDDSPLLQLPHVKAGDPLFEKLSRMLSEGTSFQELLPWESAPSSATSAASSAISSAAATMLPQQSRELFRALSTLPRIRVTSSWIKSVGDEQNVDESGDIVLHTAMRELAVLTKIENRPSGLSAGFTAHAPRYPKGREEGWWLLVCSGDSLLCSKRIGSRNSAVTRLSVPSTGAEAPDVVLHVMSDCYVGLDCSVVLSGRAATRLSSNFVVHFAC